MSSYVALMLFNKKNRWLAGLTTAQALPSYADFPAIIIRSIKKDYNVLQPAYKALAIKGTWTLNYFLIIIKLDFYQKI